MHQKSLILFNRQKNAQNKDSIKKEFLRIKSKIISDQKNNASNACITTLFDEAEKQIDAIQNIDSNKPLFGVFYVAKDNIMIKDTITTCGSKFLEFYRSPFNATVIENFNKNGAICIAKTNLDELSYSGTGLDSGYGFTFNPYDKTRIIGGSTSGTSYLISKKIINVGIASDTGDSARLPASHAGIIGFKPSYGLISRYGMFSFCVSFDTVSLMSRYVTDLAITLDAVEGYDEKDPASIKDIPARPKNFFNAVSQTCNQKWNFAVIQKTFSDQQKLNQNVAKESAKIKEEFEILLQTLEADGHKVNRNIMPDFEKFCIPLLYILHSYIEALSCSNNLTGLNFGPIIDQSNLSYEEILQKSRATFGNNLIYRLLIGHHLMYQHPENSSINFYLSAKEMCYFLIKEFDELFNEYDFIISPASEYIPPLIENVLNGKSSPNNNIESILKIANFLGSPSISLPWIKYNGLPIGLCLTANKLKDKELLIASKYFEDKLWAGLPWINE